MTTTISNSTRLRYKIEMVLPELMAAGYALTSDPRLTELYPEYMFTMHSMIRASVPLMEAALRQTRSLDANDPVAAGVARYLAKHIREEMHHDDWLLDDLEVLGYDRKEILQRAPYPSVAAMVGSQYYWIFHYHPVALLGYIAVMEGYPPTLEQVDEQVARTGLPRQAFRTVIKHAHLDPHHRDDLNAALDELPLTPEQASIIGVSAMQTVHLGSQAIRDAIERGTARLTSQGKKS